MAVPTTALVRPGALVHIVLKQDQPTGRTVHGVVQAVLTRGNHPRGIKVRLADGRVGRVQAMATGDATGNAPAATTMAASTSTSTSTATSTPYPPRWMPGPSDVRDEPVPQEQIGLDAFIKPAKQKKKQQQQQQQQASTPAPTATCPVCNAFQGDADAVAHHVAGHFA